MTENEFERQDCQFKIDQLKIMLSATQKCKYGADLTHLYGSLYMNQQTILIDEEAIKVLIDHYEGRLLK